LDLQGDESDKDKDLYSGSAIAFAGILWIEIASRKKNSDYRDNVRQAALWLVNHQFPLDYKIREVRGAFKDLKFRGGRGVVVNRDLGSSFGVRFLVKYYRSGL
jgi:hypothetical protein